MNTTEFDYLRHDIKNLLTSMRSGCLLLQRNLERQEIENAHTIVEEMRQGLERGDEIIERINRLQAST